MEYMIRQAEVRDIPEVAELYRAWEREGVTTGLRADTPDELTGKLGPWFLVAIDDEDQGLVGFITAREHQLAPSQWAVLPEGGRYLNIEDLYVVPPLRRRGLGTRLCRTLLDAAASHGIEHVAVYSSSQPWRNVVRFYESVGLSVWFVQMFR